MGQIKSTIDLSGSMVNGILLGDPVKYGDKYIWDDDRIPDIEIIVSLPIEP